MKILVTGCGGYIGNVLIRHLLNKGYEVKGIDNFHKGQCDGLLDIITHPKFEFKYGDITYIEHCINAVKNVDAIIHLAGIVGFPNCKKQPILSHGVNVLGTRNILSAKDTYNPKVALVFASTCSIYGKVEGVCTETSKLNPQSLYGIHKCEAEDLVSQQSNAVSLRFATGFGVSPNMRICLLVNDLVYQAIHNKCLTIFQADFRRTFIHVRDMARVLIFSMEQLLENKLLHKVYNAGGNNLNWTKRQLAEYIKEKTGCYLTYAEIGQDEDQRDYEVDYSRLTNAGWQPSETMEEGINELIKAAPLLQIHHQYE